jgi:sugar lactone lactonase YvrE
MIMNEIKPELILDTECPLGENPLWRREKSQLYWIDIPSGRIYRYTPAKATLEQFETGNVIGGFTIQRDGSLLLFGEGGSIRCWRKGEVTLVLDGIPEVQGTRFNDVIAEPGGGVFCGTLSTGQTPGCLYYLSINRQLTKVLDGILCSNGMGFSPDIKRFYYTDSDRREIYAFDFGFNGQIENKETIVHIPEGEGVPDGLTVDMEGCIWSARWDGGCLVRYDPRGTEVLRIPFPAKKVTSITFGGKDFKDMYITTAGGDQKEEEGQGAGGLFRLRLGIQGLPEFISRVSLST